MGVVFVSGIDIGEYDAVRCHVSPIDVPFALVPACPGADGSGAVVAGVLVECVLGEGV